MSVSRHPIALRLERTVGEGTKLLATVMGLPLVDGIFPAVVLAGALSTTLGIIEVGLLIFGGSATLAVVLAEMEGTRREQVASVLAVGALIIGVATIEAALAPTIQSFLNMEIFTRFAALVILAIAAKTASATVGEYLPSPGVIIGLGLIASFQPGAVTIQFVTDPMLVARGAAAAGVGVAFALSAALFAPWLRGSVNIDRFRFGSAVALGVLPLSILGIIQANVPLALAVLGVTGLLAFDPEGTQSVGDSAAAVTDGGDEVEADDAEAEYEDEEYEDDADISIDTEESDGPSLGDGDRAPWL
ncbi:DUF5794 domain-containing protein [Natronomonas sp. EA1]|uniref:DUF5794 domain-containing protein n=1 Tax=Natronomonas sp. EA1 TaxID=3421655 RepID=UPI003EB6B5F1